jgi:hypothetical protein
MSDLKINNITNRGGDGGPVIAGVSTVATSAFMVMPSGDIEIRGAGSGRGVFGTGYNNAPNSSLNSMQYVAINSQSNTIDFGDLSNSSIAKASFGSATRGFWAGGDSVPGQADNKTIDFTVISSLGGANDFGEMTNTKAYFSGMSNDIRGFFVGGATTPEYVRQNVIEYVIMASTGNGNDFGDLSLTSMNNAPVANKTRGLIALGQAGPSNNSKQIQFITLSTLGDAQDFGEITTLAKKGAAAVASSTRACFMGGTGTTGNAGHVSNVIDFVTISTLGNAQDFGDITVAVDALAGASNSTRGLHAGGRTGSPAPEALQNVIGFITIASAGNATDFGDLVAPTRYLSGCSDAHGGLQ